MKQSTKVSLGVVIVICVFLVSDLEGIVVCPFVLELIKKNYS